MTARRIYVALCAVALAVIAAAYSNTLDNQFHFDDTHVLENNLYVRSLSNLPRYFTDAQTFSALPANAAYRPLVTASLAVDYKMAGGLASRRVYHESMIVMMLVLAALLAAMYHHLLDQADPSPWNRWVALAAATLVAVHTTATETMNLMHARSELLSGIGVVGSFVLYLYAPRLRALYVYLVPMLVGALAKDPAVLFGALFVVYVFLYEGQYSVADLLSTRGWAVAWPAIRKGIPALVLGGGAFVFIESMAAEAATYGGGSRIAYLQTQAFAWAHYLRLFLLPIGLSADTDWTPIAEWYDTRVVSGAAIVGLLVWGVWVASRRRELRAVSFGLAWFILALLPASSIFPLAEVINEHRPFFAYMGLSLALVQGLAVALRTHAFAASQRVAATVAATLVCVVVGGNAVGTYERNRTWSTSESLWKDVAQKSPGNGRGLMNYGLTHMAAGRYAEAEALFLRAERLVPNYSSLQINLAITVDRLGRPADAEARFQRALSLAPNAPGSHYFFARWLTERARPREAVPHLERTIQLSNGDVAARQLLMMTYANLSETQKLHALAADTLRLVPGDQAATRFLTWQPGTSTRDTATPSMTAEGLLNESLAMYQSGDFEGCIKKAQEAIALRPNFAQAYNNMAAAHASLKQWDAAIAAAKEALRIQPDFALAKNNLAWAESGKKGVAR